MPEPQFNPDAELRRLMMAPQQGNPPEFDPAAELARLQMQPRRLTPMPTATGPGALGRLDDLGRMAAQGASFGFADELSAGMNAGIGAIGDLFTTPTEGSTDPRGFSARYDRNLAEERARDAQIRQDMPIAASAAELAGGVAGGVGMARAAPAVFGVTQPGGLLRRVWEGSRAGTVGGALGGFGSSEGGIENRGQGALRGAAMGGVVGGAVPAVASAVAYPAARVAGAVGNAMGWRNAEEAGLGQLLRAFQRDAQARGMTLEQGLADANARYSQWVRDGARPETLVDLGGENVRAFAQRLVNVPGASRQAGRDAVEARTMGQGDRVAADLEQATGQRGNQFYPEFEALNNARRADAAPLYQAAYARDFVPNDNITGWLQRPAMRDAARRAYTIAANEGRNPESLGLALNEAGDVIYQRAPSMQTLDYIKRGLDDVLEGFRDSVTGRLRLDEAGRAINNLRAQFVRELRTLNPEYGRALDDYAGPSQLIDAMNRGRGIFSPDAEITAAMVRAMSPTEREAFRMGAVRAIQDRINNTGDGRNVVASFFRAPALRARVEAAFDSPADFMRFQAAMNREMSMAQNNQFMNPRANSMTSRMLAEGEDQTIDVPSSAIMQLLTGHPIQALRTGGVSALNAVQGMNSATSDALAPVLFNTTAAGNQRALGILASEQQRRNFDRLQRQNRLFGLIGGGGGGPRAPKSGIGQ